MSAGLQTARWRAEEVRLQNEWLSTCRECSASCPPIEPDLDCTPICEDCA